MSSIILYFGKILAIRNIVIYLMVHPRECILEALSVLVMVAV